MKPRLTNACTRATKRVAYRSTSTALWPRDARRWTVSQRALVSSHSSAFSSDFFLSLPLTALLFHPLLCSPFFPIACWHVPLPLCAPHLSLDYFKSLACCERSAKP